METQGTIIIGTEVDTTGLEEGLKDIKKEHGDEEITINTDKTSKGMQTISSLASKIASKVLGISVSSAKILGSIAGIILKLGLIGGLLGIVALVGLGIATSFKSAIQKNDELTAKMQYLKLAIQSALNAFASAGEFLVKIFSWLIDRVYDILAVLGAIIKLITGVNIFADAIAGNFAEANNNAGKLKKTLAGFDEMNIMSDTGGGTGLIGDIASDFSKIRNLEKEVETVSKKIKAWFTKGFPNREEVEDLWKPARDMWTSIGDWLDKNVISYWKILFQNFVDYTRPLWEPVADAFKQAFSPLAKYIDDNFITPLKTKFTTFKDNFLSKYAKFINTIIYWINTTFGMFGVNLEYIDEESAITGKDVKENIGESLQKVKEDSDNTANSIKTLRDRLQDLTNRTWKFVINLVTNGNINQKLQPLRNALSQIGINLPNIQLAKGGIINMPGRGVPVGSAIAGERGQEGVIPLTDSQQMALLGEAIGKYININATVPVYVGNRMVAREIKRINAEDNFAYNR